MPRVYLGLGTNLGDRLAMLRSAVAGLRALGTLAACSSVYETEPWGLANQPRFLNLCCALDTPLAPADLHARTKQLEATLGRQPGARWGPRVIDVDLLAYDRLALHTDTLQVPHPRIAERAFVLAPLAEIAPDLPLPSLAGTPTELLAALPGATTQAWRVAPPADVLGDA